MEIGNVGAFVAQRDDDGDFKGINTCKRMIVRSFRTRGQGFTGLSARGPLGFRLPRRDHKM